MLTSLMLATVMAVQPAPTAATPLEVLDTFRFNEARADDAIMHHVVDLTGPVSYVYRDGIGGYVARLDVAIREVNWEGRAEIHCHFDVAARSGLAAIKPGGVVTIRGIPRQTKDHLHWPVDPNVRLDVKDCTLLIKAEETRAAAN